MKLSKRNWWIRLAYLAERETPPKASICNLFWRGMLNAGVVGCLAGFLVAVGVGIYKGWPHSLKVVGIFTLLFGTFIASVVKYDSVPVQYVIALKRKMCPLVEISR